MEPNGSEPRESLHTLAGRMAGGAGISFVGKVAGFGLRYLSQLTLAWFLGPGRFGVYALASGILEMLQQLAKMGLGIGATRFAAVHIEGGDPARLKGVLLSAGRLPFLVGIALASLLMAGAEPLAAAVFDEPSLAPVLRVFAVALPFGASMQVMAQATTGFGVTKYMVTTLYLVHPGADLFLILILCGAGLGLLGASLAWLAAGIVGCLVGWMFARNLYLQTASPDVEAVHERGRLLGFSIPLLAGEFLWVAMLWTDVLMLGFFTDSAEVGIYRAASQTAILLTLIPFAVNSIFSPMIAGLEEQKDRSRMLELFQVSTRWSLAASLPLFSGIAIASEDLLQIYGSEFAVGWLPLVILVSGQLVNCGTGGVGPMLTMTGHQYHKVVGDVFVTVTNVLLNLYLIPRHGLVGAAVATSIAVSGTNLLRLLQVRMILGIQPYSRRFLKPALAGAVALASGLAVNGAVEQFHFLVGVFATGSVVVVVFAAVLWWLGPEEVDRNLLDEWWQDAPGRAGPRASP